MAGRPIWIKKGGNWKKIRPDQNAIGGSLSQSFIGHCITIDKLDEVFLFSDGLSDQFGGKRNKKFLTKRIMNHLKENDGLGIKKKGELLKNSILEWKGDLEQTDDISYISIQF